MFSYKFWWRIDPSNMFVWHNNIENVYNIFFFAKIVWRLQFKRLIHWKKLFKDISKNNESLELTSDSFLTVL